MKACVVVTDNNVKRAISTIEKFEIAEIRLDICQFRTQYYREIFSLPTKTIATYREADSSNASIQKMECLKKALENGASYLDLELELKALENKLNKWLEIKQGMMQNLLTGKIRLVCQK